MFFDREERNRCANTIVATMDVMFPELHSEADYRQKLWDHLAIMSNFQLDVDYPYPVIQQEKPATPKPSWERRGFRRTLRSTAFLVDRSVACSLHGLLRAIRICSCWTNRRTISTFPPSSGWKGL